MDWVIGGQPMIGKGWRMLMECLAAGRGISLPSSNDGHGDARGARASAAMRACARSSRSPIGKFEGVEEALARIGGNLYMMDATRMLTAAAIDLGEKPAVLSAIAKYHITERARQIINDAMDVHRRQGHLHGAVELPRRRLHAASRSRSPSRAPTSSRAA